MPGKPRRSLPLPRRGLDDVTQGGGLSAERDVTRAGRPAMKSPGGRDQARAPVSSRAGAGLERVSAAESKQARDPPFPSGSSASRSARGPVAPARLRASGGRAWPRRLLPGRARRPEWRGAGRAAGRAPEESGRPALSVAARALPRGATFVGAGHRDTRERVGEMPNPKNSKGGRKNKRANSSGDEQENGAGALAAAGATGAAAGGALAAAAGCGAVSLGAVGTGGAAGPGGAGTGAANATIAAGAAAAGDAKNGKTTAAGRAPTSSPTGGRGGGALGGAGGAWTMRVRKCSPRPSAPRWLSLRGPHAEQRGQRLRAPRRRSGSVSTPRGARAG